jgi:ABC-type glycerol-3-phosphate transport system substrate-binding protein
MEVVLPVPSKNNQTSTLMVGYAFGIPQTSTHKDLAWMLIETTLQPDILGPFPSQTGLLVSISPR